MLSRCCVKNHISNHIIPHSCCPPRSRFCVMKPQHRIEHSTEFSTRRRALFPSEKPDNDLDLDSISPLNFEEDNVSVAEKVFSLNESIDNYDIIGLVVKGNFANTPTNNIVSTKIVTPTTSDESPTQKLKTPHDLPDNTKIPKLIRNKTQTDSIPVPDCKNSKVRTALFPEVDMSLPSRTFYPKHDNEVSPRKLTPKLQTSPNKKRKKQKLYLCGKKNKYRSGINAGVSHKIKKRKSKKINKLTALQAAINIIDKSPLNDICTDKSKNLKPVNVQESTPVSAPEHSKKILKSKRQKTVFSLNSNIKVEMSKGQFTYICNKNPLKRSSTCDEVEAKRPKLVEFEQEEPLLPEKEISNIIDKLGNFNDKENMNTEGAALMSPTSQMCNMTSGLAINSPKKARDLSSVLEAMPSKNEDPQKLFPVFYPGKTQVSIIKSEPVRQATKKFRAVSKDQMLLDAGQKRWGATQCPECKIVYHMGDPGDEIMHLNYHNASHIFKFNGWKNERVVSNEFLNGKIIQITPNDSKLWWKKVREVLEVVNRDLGFYEMELNTVNSQTFFYIKNRTIVGVLVAEPVNSAHKLITMPQDQIDLCSEESYPIKCGVSRIWVNHNHRKTGIATALMDCLKRNFMFGCILRNEDIAVTSPTELGKVFCREYFKTPNFLIYFV